MSSGLEISALNLDLGVSRAQSLGGGSLSPTTVNGTEQQSFADVVKSAGESVVNTLNNAEAASIAGIKGDVGPYKVAAAVMEAEQTLRMTIAIRDKAVQAYQEISRMQI